jgi:hypothetical protein
MALNNYKTILKGSEVISSGYSAFFGNLKAMKTIKRIKKSHDTAWYNEYLKISKKIKKLFKENADYDNVVTIAKKDMPTTDDDIITLYLTELYLSHDVRYIIEDDIYTIQLTHAYMGS